MKSDPKMPMSHFLYTDPKANRQQVTWSESEKQKFYNAVREVGNKPYKISDIIGSGRTYTQVLSHIKLIRRFYKKNPTMPNADVAKILME